MMKFLCHVASAAFILTPHTPKGGKGRRLKLKPLLLHPKFKYSMCKTHLAFLRKYSCQTCNSFLDTRLSEENDLTSVFSISQDPLVNINSAFHN